MIDESCFTKMVLGGLQPCQFLRAIFLVDLLVEGAEIIQPSDHEKPAGEEPEDAGKKFPHVEAVDAEEADKGLQDPGQRIVIRSSGEAMSGVAVHAGD